MLLKQTIVFAFCTIFVKTDPDFGVVSTSPEPSLQTSEIDVIKNELRTLQTQMEKLLQNQDASRVVSSQQASEIIGIKDEMKMLQKQNERVLQDLEKLSNSNDALNRNYSPKSCQDVQDRGHNATNIYFIKPELGHHKFAVLCDMERRGGGWTYLLNRFDGSQDFNLNWNEYKVGFGTLNQEFWLGLDNIHYLTGSEKNELLVELVDFNGTEAYAHYGLFSIGSEEEGYSLKLLGDYDGTAGDDLSYSLNMKFSTRDKDQDSTAEACASYWGGPWWHKNCMNAFLMGNYDEAESPNDLYKRMFWYKFREFQSLKQARMMVRPSRNTGPILLPHDKH